MKKFILILLLLSTSFSFAQNFTASLSISLGVSGFQSKSPEVFNKTKGLCFAAGILEEYKLSKILSVGMGIGYSNTKGSFDAVEVMSPSLMTMATFRHSPTIQSIDVPLVCKARLSNGFCFSWGAGMSYGLSVKDELANVRYKWTGPALSQEVIPFSSSRNLIASQGWKYLVFNGFVGIGQEFNIKNARFFAEMKYQMDFNSWAVRSVWDPVNEQYYIQRQALSLSFGMPF